MRWPWLLLVLLTPAAAFAAPQTTIELVDFGVGNAFRPGGPIGIRVKVTSDLDEAVNGLIQWEIENGDGDIAEYSREIAIQPRGGQTISWMYGVLPPVNDATSILDTDWRFRLFELDGTTKVREIASSRLSPRSAQSPTRAVQLVQDQILVIGPNAAGLSGYEPKPGFNMNPALNSTSAIVWGTQSEDLPDSWEGLSPYSTIVWSNAGDSPYSPGEVDGRRDVEEALVEWISRGGHLVILLPSAGNPWRLGLDQTALGDLLSDVKAELKDGVLLSSLLPALSTGPGLNTPYKTMAIQTFDPDTLSKSWHPLAAIELNTETQEEQTTNSDSQRTAAEVLTDRMQDSTDASEKTVEEPVLWAVRRNHGFGAIDLVGIDVANPDLQNQQSPAGLPQTGVFWRPILGRRATAPSATVLSILKDEKRIPSSTVSSNYLGRGNLISTQIGLGGAAAQGLLAAMGLFAVYWLVAGPGGFAILRNFKFQRHAWLVFVGTATVFAVLAWLGSRFLQQGSSVVRHVTVLSHIYDATDDEKEISQLDVASLWFSARLPGYGMVEVGIGQDTDSSDSSKNILDHYSPPPIGSRDRFPDSDRYTVPFSSRAKYNVPARATSAEFVGKFKGVPVARDGAWGGTISVKPENPLKLEQDKAAGTTKLTGILLNKSGVNFTRVVLIQIHPLRTPAPRSTTSLMGVPLIPDELPNYGLFFETTTWGADQELDLEQVMYKNGPLAERYRGRNSIGAGIKRSFVDQYARQGGFGSVNEIGSLSNDDQIRYLSMLGLYESLPPPTWVTEQGKQPDTVRFQRMLGQAIDQTRHFSEGCLLVFAFAKDVPCPVPISIDGENPRSEGRVMLQWIHPLRSANIHTEIEGLTAGSRWPKNANTSASVQSD